MTTKRAAALAWTEDYDGEGRQHHVVFTCLEDLEWTINFITETLRQEFGDYLYLDVEYPEYMGRLTGGDIAWYGYTDDEESDRLAHGTVALTSGFTNDERELRGRHGLWARVRS